MVQKNYNIKNHFINSITKQGKKTKVNNLYNNILFNLKKKKKNNPKPIFEASIAKILPKIKLTKISKFKSTILPLNEEKQLNTAIKWLIEPTNKKISLNKERIILEEILNIQNKTGITQEKKKTLYRDAQKFKYNIKKTYK